MKFFKEDKITSSGNAVTFLIPTANRIRLSQEPVEIRVKAFGADDSDSEPFMVVPYHSLSILHQL
jgi:hypothetical protein